MSKLPVTAIILTFNEEIHIARCLSRILPFVERVVVIDSFSTDRTVEIARSFGAEVLQNAWRHSHAIQFQWGMDNATPQSDWVLKLDADEYLDDALIEELRERLLSLPAEVTGISMKRKLIFRDRWIRFGGVYPVVLLRLWRRGAGRVEQRWMDEHIVLTHGSAITLKADFVDHNLNDIAWWTDKHNGYTTRQMVDFISQEYGLAAIDRGMERSGTRQARIKRYIRSRVFARAPLYLRGTGYFLVRYFLLLGFLDGRQGLVFHFLQGWWNWMLIDAKIDEARLFIEAHGTEAFRRHLKARHGIEI